MIFSSTVSTFEEHQRQVREVLEVLRQHKLYAKESKCEIYQRSVEFLGHIESIEHGLHMMDREA